MAQRGTDHWLAPTLARKLTLTVLTANTQFGRACASVRNCRQLVQGNPDVIVLQEVIGVPEDTFRQRFLRLNYSVALYNPLSGLAIVVYNAPYVSVLDFITQPLTHIPHFVTSAMQKSALQHHVRPSNVGMVRILFHTQTIEVGTTHLAVCARPLGRYLQIRRLAAYLNQRNLDLPLILAGDMNHYPAPGLSDKFLIRATHMQHFTPLVPTWKVAGTKYEWAARIGAKILRTPLSTFDGKLDAVLYSGGLTRLRPLSVRCIPIASDHRAVLSSFMLY